MTDILHKRRNPERQQAKYGNALGEHVHYCAAYRTAVLIRLRGGMVEQHQPNDRDDMDKEGDQWNGVRQPASRCLRYSHSIVPGGLLVMSYVTRLIPRTSFTMRVATRFRNAISNG